jgi:adenylyltransferase/sulfurtransferase
MFGKKIEIPLAIDVFRLKALMDQLTQDLFLLDCREPHERAVAAIEPSMLIPMREIPERLSELEPFRQHNIVVYCHAGIRSLKVTQFLRQHGLAKAQSLTGGIDAWSRLINPAVPRY